MAEIRPADIAAPAANYAHAVLTESASCWLHTSGVVPVAPGRIDPRFVGRPGGGRVGEHLRRCCATPTCSPSDIVSVTTYVVVGEDLAPVMAARDQALGDHCGRVDARDRSGTGAPEWRMEVAVVAAR